jgi:hypothetical protein
MTKLDEREEENYIDTEDYDQVLPETDNKRWELDEEPIIQNLRREIFLRVNDTGVEEIIGWLRISLAKNSALTNLKDDEIDDFLRYEMDAFIEECRVNNKRWGFKSPASRSAIVQWVFKSSKNQLKRAFNDGERKYRKDSYQYNENYHHDEVNSNEIGSGFRLPFTGRKKQRREQEEQF